MSNLDTMTALSILVILAFILVGYGCKDATAQDWMPGANPVQLPAVGNEAPKKFCPVCQAEKKKSTVYAPTSGACTLMSCGGGHWDEDGKYHAAEPCNTCSYVYSCSNGHEWTESEPAW